MGKLDITGADEKKIGYYAGFIAEFNYFFCAKQDEANRALIPFVVGIDIFRDRGYHRLPMESDIRSYWKKASPHVWNGRNDFIHGILWIVSYIFYPCDQVRRCLHVVC